MLILLVIVVLLTCKTLGALKDVALEFIICLIPIHVCLTLQLLVKRNFYNTTFY